MCSRHMQPPKAATLFHILKKSTKGTRVSLLLNELWNREKQYSIVNPNKTENIQINEYQNTPFAN